MERCPKRVIGQVQPLVGRGLEKKLITVRVIISLRGDSLVGKLDSKRPFRGILGRLNLLVRLTGNQNLAI